jgi:hypothetical protein
MNSDPLKEDFRVFLAVVWEYLHLPDTTDIQYDIGRYLAFGPLRRIIQAFRGVGKSWITVAYVLWRLYCDPQLNILVVSASKQAADNFTTFCLQLIYGMPELAHLKPRTGQRDAKIQFDVGPAEASKDPSVKSVGITGQITGTRADLIVADDVEVPSNSMTQQQRDKLSELVKEFDAILKPGGDIVYLGTPQTEASLYAVLQTRGYSTRIWPARYPAREAVAKHYGTRLSPMLAKAIEDNPGLIGYTTEPRRFSNEDLMIREASYGRSGFALQFMLDTSLADAHRYPLKLSDLIVMDLSPTLAPSKIVWATAPELTWNDLPSVGLAGDRFYRPMSVSKDAADWTPYSGSVLAIDPAGRGGDEVGYAVVKAHLGMLFTTALGGLQGGYGDDNLIFLAKLAKEHQVKLVIIEKNFGDGMFTKLIQPHLGRIYPVTVEEIHSSTQKEKRIIDTLEPVFNQHRMVVDRKVIEHDHASTQGDSYGDRGMVFQAFYQMTRITKDRGALPKYDRLDAWAMAVAYWVESMGRDTFKAEAEQRQKLLDLELKSFIRSATQTLTGRARPISQPTWM